MNQPQAIYRLHLLETSLDDAKHRLDEIEQALQNDEAVQTAQALMDTRTRDFKRIEDTVQALEHELTTLIQKLETNEALLYSGQITSHREVEDRKNEVESLKRRRTNLESELSGARDSFKEYRNVYEEAKHQLAEAQAANLSQNKDLIAERDHLKQNMAQWLKERKTALEAVDPNVHKLYKHVKKQKHGVAVARLEEDTCSVCRVEQNQTLIYQIRHSKEIIQCQSCGRILVEA